MDVLAVVAHWAFLLVQCERTFVLLVMTQARQVYAKLEGLSDAFVGSESLEFATRFKKMIPVARRTFLGSGGRVDDGGAKADS